MIIVKDRVLFILNLIEEVRGAAEEVSLAELFTFFPLSRPKRNLYAALSYAVKNGDVKRVSNGSKDGYRLTFTGKKKLQKDFPLVSFRKREWDGKWRVLIYDVPDSRKSAREGLRRKVRQYGFGKLQNSTYISPFPIEKAMVDFLEANFLTNKVIFMTADNIFSGGDKYLAENIWKLTRLNTHYGRILEELREKETEERDLNRLRGELVGLLEIDPFLPNDLLPKPWFRDETIKKLIR